MFGRTVAKVMTASWLAAGTLLLACASLEAQDLSQEQRQRMYYRVKPAVVMLETRVQGQIQVQTPQGPVRGEARIGGGGSGWLVTPDGYLVTNGHVVAQFHDQNEEQLRIQLLYQFLEAEYFPALGQARGQPLSQNEKIQVLVQMMEGARISLHKELDVVLQNGDRYSAEVKQYSPGMNQLPGRISVPGRTFETGKDVAVVKIEGRNLPTVAIGNSDELSIGDDVFVAGYPGVVESHDYLSQRTQLEPSFTRGTVSSVKMTVAGGEVTQVDAAMTWGNSGGPVFNAQGEVVGMATFISLHQGGSGVQAIQGFNFAVPTSTIMEFVRAEGVQPTPGLFNQVWTTALGHYYEGRWNQAVEGFDEVLRVTAGLPDAVQLRSLAVARRDEQGFPGWIIWTVVALGLLLISSGLMLRRRTATATVGSHGSVRALGGNGRKALPSSSRLVVREGPLQGNRFPISASGIKIGRDPSSCQVVLSEPATSREHAIIIPSGGNGEVTIRNLSGTNPTYVNDRPIQETVLRHGDRIKIAGSVLTFETE